MNNKINFNIQANSYVPKTMRQQQQTQQQVQQPKFEERGIEVINVNKGVNQNYKNNQQNYKEQDNIQNLRSNQQNYYKEENNSYNYRDNHQNYYNEQDNSHNYNQNEYYNYDKNQSKGKRGDKQNKNYYQEEDYSAKGGQFSNQYEQEYKYQDNYKRDNYKKDQYQKDNYQTDQYQKNQYQDQYKKNNYPDKYQDTSQNQYQDKYQKNTYQDKYQQNTYQDKYQKDTYKDKYQQNQYPDKYQKDTYQDKYQQNQYPDKYQQNTYQDKYQKDTYQDKYQKNYTNSYQKDSSSYKKSMPNQNFHVVQKDLDSHFKPSRQDLEDDYLDAETYAGDEFSHSELTGDAYGEEDDFYGDENYDDYASKYYQEKIGFNQDFSKMTLNESDKTDSSKSKKHLLVFSNKEGFTNYVEELIQNNNRSKYINDGYVNILMIAEKPSIAKSLSEALGGSSRSRKLGKGNNVFNFEGYFGNIKAKITVSSVMGHVYTSDFQREHNDWESIDVLELYDVPVAKVEANKKTRIPYTLQKLAMGKDILCLWLDCDKEGENICYEVIYNCVPFMNKKNYQQIYRAKFSSLTKTDLIAAYNRLSDPPNKNESLSVDARQVIDLKIGVSFTRFLTSAILPGIKNADTKLLSYGPCQTPTLWFCVDRQNEINNFKSKEYFKIHLDLEINKIKYKVPYKKKFFDKNELNQVMAKIKESKSARVVKVITTKNSKPAPVGLNTVQMLRVASSYLRMSPHETMVNAERLYTGGFMTYPRTETTKYAPSFDIVKTLNDFSLHPTFGKQITAMLKNYRKPAPKGVDVGDHPPITPSRVATAQDLKGDQWRLYEFICTNFFASVAEAAEFEEKTFQIEVSGEIFEAESILLTKEGFLKFMPWKRSNYNKDFPMLKQDQVLTVVNIASESNWTEPREYLSESDLIKLMEHNKIGTDASMPVHIENISQRGYVKVDGARRLIPTKLGKALIESLSAVDPELVQPTIRAEIEGYVDQVAKGQKKYEDITNYTMELYKKKFLNVRQHYDKLLNNFKKYFEIDMMEMNKVYKSIKSKNEALKIKNMVKKDPSQVTTDLNTCDSCKKGKMYVEFDELDKYLLLCTNCKLRKKIVRDAIKINVEKSLQCQKCSCNYVSVEVENPFLNGETQYTGCLFCDPNLC